MCVNLPQQLARRNENEQCPGISSGPCFAQSKVIYTKNILNRHLSNMSLKTSMTELLQMPLVIFPGVSPALLLDN